MLASIPASILNHIRDHQGIPSDSEKISHALGSLAPADRPAARLRRSPRSDKRFGYFHM